MMRRPMATMQIAEKFMSGPSVTPRCPRCKQVIPSEDINVAGDVAFCRHCDLSHRLSALTSGTVVDEDVDINQPPAGCWFTHEGDVLAVGATHRALGQAFGLLFMSLFWNGIVSVFVTLAVSSTLRHLGLRPPAWFPALKGASAPVGMTIFLWLFLTPFIAIGLVLLATFLSSLGGRTEIRIEGEQGTLFSGIGPVGFRKRFSSREVKDIRIEENQWVDRSGYSRRRAQAIIETDRNSIPFGSMLTPQRRRFVAGALKRELVRR